MDGLLYGLLAMTWQQAVMIGIGFVLIYLAIAKEYEPVLLLPIGFGAILTNIPGSSAVGPGGFLTILYDAGIITELFPILIFIGVGAMIDFTPLLQQPAMLFFGRRPSWHFPHNGYGRAGRIQPQRKRRLSVSSVPQTGLLRFTWRPSLPATC